MAAASLSCAGREASFDTHFASDFVRTGHTVSVFGVYKDGQMSSEAWDAIASGMRTAIAGSPCEAGYGRELASKADLAAAVDDYARSNGPTDDLLVQLAPAARGDLILVVTVAGKLPPKPEAAHSPGSGASMGGASLGGGGGGGGLGGGGPTPMAMRSHNPASTDELDLSASFFSVARSESMALVSMRYVGSSIDEATTMFATQLAQAIPQATCSGWKWDIPLDAEHLRRSISP